jgi:predicted DNA binding CopG/RHH family protein
LSRVAREHIKQWTVRLSQALIDAVKAQARAEGKEPSHLVEEWLWLALSLVGDAPRQEP